jgi:hypothetical protein
MAIEVSTKLASRAVTLDFVKFCVNELEVIQRKFTTALTADETGVQHFFVVNVGTREDRRHT